MQALRLRTRAAAGKLNPETTTSIRKTIRTTFMKRILSVILLLVLLAGPAPAATNDSLGQYNMISLFVTGITVTIAVLWYAMTLRRRKDRQEMEVTFKELRYTEDQLKEEATELSAAIHGEMDALKAELEETVAKLAREKAAAVNGVTTEMDAVRTEMIEAKEEMKRTLLEMTRSRMEIKKMQDGITISNDKMERAVKKVREVLAEAETEREKFQENAQMGLHDMQEVVTECSMGKRDMERVMDELDRMRKRMMEEHNRFNRFMRESDIIMEQLKNRDEQSSVHMHSIQVSAKKAESMVGDYQRSEEHLQQVREAVSQLERVRANTAGPSEIKGDSEEELMALAIREEGNGDWESALSYWQDIAYMRPSVEAHTAIGMNASQLAKERPNLAYTLLRRARQHFQLAVDLNRDAQTLNNLGIALTELYDYDPEPGRLEEACRNFEEAASMNPGMASYTSWGTALSRLAEDSHNGREESALLLESLDKHTKATELNPKDSLAWYNLSSVNAHLSRIASGEKREKRLRAALMSAEEALSLNQDYLPAMESKANIYLELSKASSGKDPIRHLERAARTLIAAENIAPGRNAYNLASVYALMREQEQCRRWLEVAARHDAIPRGYLTDDPDLEAVRNERWFQKMAQNY